MTTVSLTPTTAAPHVSFGRLLLVEGRKLVDTVGGRWLFGITLLVAVAATFLPFLMSNVAPEGAVLVWTEPLNVGVMIFTLLLPVAGVWSMAQEWTHQTALTTFAVEPRRLRVLVAKLVAALTASLAMFIVLAAWSLLVTVVFDQTSTLNVEWTPQLSTVAGLLAGTLFAMLQGLALGALLMNTPAALVLYFLAPPMLLLLGQISEQVAEATSWVNPQLSLASLIGGDWANVPWAKVAVGTLIWVVIPLVAGAFRTLKREVK